jgi:GR25 family glycosyltransferase involved in LPS biosynthesis
MELMAARAGIELTFFDAINGRALPKSTLNDYLSLARQTPRNIKNLSQTDFTAGEVGCALSNLTLLDRIRKGSDKGAVILDDDVVFSDDFKKLVFEIEEMATPNHLILLGGSTGHDYFNRGQMYSPQHGLYIRYFGAQRLSNSAKLGVPIDRIWGSFAYWIGRDAAGKIVDYAQDAFMVADQFTSDSPLLGIRLLALNKPIVFPDFSFTSDLRSEHAHLEVARHQKSTVLQKLINNYKSIRRLFISNFIKGEYAYLYEAPFSRLQKH